MINLYDYQKRYLSDLPARAIMAADTGTGKTFMSLAHYEQHGGRRPLLILAPASKVRTGDWVREIEEYFSGKDQASQFAYEIYSYEKFSRDEKLWKRFAPLYGGESWAVICDEVHKIKNPQSKMGKVVYQVTRQGQFFVGLSATPLPNGWIDVANYFKVFGFVKHITDFKRKYCKIQTYKGWPEIIGYERENELAHLWQSISKKLTKAEANDLPSRTFIPVKVDKPKEYTKLMKTRVLDDGTFLDTAPALAHAVRQTLTKPKIEFLKDLLLGTQENTVIFYNYVSEREAILEMLAKTKDLKGKTVFRQDGGAHELPKKQDWQSVHNSITLAQYMSGSTGVEMTYATQVVYFSPTYSYADYIQSIGRVYRNGQTQKTTFYNVRTTGTIEVPIYRTLKGKQDFQVKQWMEDE